jgi:aminoglycoside phosphotransferase (APT) family kinase protein
MPRAALDIDQVASGLRRYVRAKCGAHSDVENLKVMEAGHAGLTFGFDLVRANAGQRRALVLKLAPQGVRRAGNTDVYRQAPLLRALHAAGMAVPDVPFASDEEQWFGAPFIMMERLAGEPFFVWQPDSAFDKSEAAVAPLWEQTIDAMVALHRFDWQRHIPDWEAPRALAYELGYWEPVLTKAPDASWIASGRQVRDRLLASLPNNAPVGLVHGDLQPGNALFEQGHLTGMIDWELASIGARWLDVGWLMMLADRASWSEDWRPLCPLTPEQIATRYALAMAERGDALPWFQAFAGYRLAAIACLNVHLHRSGRRPDATWEHFADVIPQLFGRSRELLREHYGDPGGLQ